MSNPIPTASLRDLAPGRPTATFVKLGLRGLARNPVIFTTAVVVLMTTILALRDIGSGSVGGWPALHISLWLWLCVLFANFAEALAEGRGKARADTLRATKPKAMSNGSKARKAPSDVTQLTPIDELQAGQFVLVDMGDVIPTDGEAVRGVASVNESAITGESAPVIREAGGSLLRHRRHHGRLRLAGAAHHRRAGQKLHGPHDCLGRSGAAKDPE